MQTCATQLLACQCTAKTCLPVCVPVCRPELGQRLSPVYLSGLALVSDMQQLPHRGQFLFSGRSRDPSLRLPANLDGGTQLVLSRVAGWRAALPVGYRFLTFHGASVLSASWLRSPMS